MFRKKLAQQTATARAQGGADRHLPFASRSTPEEDVGHIDATDQQHETYSGEQHHQAESQASPGKPCEFAVEIVNGGFDRNAPTVVLVNFVMERCDLRLGSLQGN